MSQLHLILESVRVERAETAAEALSFQTLYGHGPCPMGRGPHLQLGAATITSPDDPAVDASPQFHRGLGQDAENRLGSMPSACELKIEGEAGRGKPAACTPISQRVCRAARVSGTMTQARMILTK